MIFADIFAALARWISGASTVVFNWLKMVFAAGVNWARDMSLDIWAWLCDSAPQPFRDHPHATLLISALIFIGPQILLLPILILHGIFFVILTVLGFGVRGIVGGSPAAFFQSRCYGGNTPASSAFALFQSIGMKYNAVTLSNWVLAIIRLLAALLFVCVVIWMICWRCATISAPGGLSSAV